jgi:hypothetical protein
MLYLIEFDRTTGERVTFRSFDDSRRREAENERIALELDLNSRGIEREVILLQASSEEDLRRTHRRYFEDLRSLGAPPPELARKG